MYDALCACSAITVQITFHRMKSVCMCNNGANTAIPMSKPSCNEPIQNCYGNNAKKSSRAISLVRMTL
jgi:hypothetical protein